jgi:tetratricopeptide (TPR) repeat protein
MDESEQIFLAARAHPAGPGRDAYLAGACPSPEQRARVEGMLRDAAAAAAFFGEEENGETVADVAGAPAVAPALERPGQMIGRYKLLQQIGEGGFGVVWMAEQVEPVVRRVALKIIKPGMDSGMVIARFEAERQALAIMDHPNIARVLDAGATGTGRPYFVMELVKGIPVTQFCDERRLDTRQRLDLFMAVCEAVGHAHQKGVIHRDLKPSNILVTLHGDRAVPKIIDFGIAKAVEQKLTDKTLFTRFEQFIGTPAYMSPEQAALSGLDIDTRSDIYSLGVLLYELLTGLPPFDPKALLAAGYDEMRRIIQQDEPPKPSTRLTQARLAHRSSEHSAPRTPRSAFPADLDWIVLKAIEKDRSRRYDTAGALAGDIRRFLADEPVLAAAPGAVYKLRKFVRRHRTATAAAAAVALALLAGTAVSVWQAVRATRARDELAAQVDETARQKERAHDNFLLAREAVDRFLKRLADDPASGARHQAQRRALLEDALGFYQRFVASGQGDPSLAAEIEHATWQIAHIHSLAGSKDEALAGYRHAISLMESTAAAAGAAPAAEAQARRRRLAGCYYDLGMTQLDLDRYDEAEVSMRRALDLRRAASGASPGEPGPLAELASSLNAVGILLNKSYRSEQAVAPLEEAAEVLGRLAELEPADPEHRSQLGAQLNSLAETRVMLGDLAGAEALLHRAVGEQRKAVEADPANGGFLNFLANHLLNLGVMLKERGDPGAAKALGEALALRERLVQQDPSVSDRQFALARTLVEQATLPGSDETGSPASPRDDLERALAVLESLLAQNPAWNNARSLSARASHLLAQWHLQDGRTGEALARWQAAAEASGRLVHDDPINAQTHQSNLARSRFFTGYLLAEAGSATEALAALEASRDTYGQLGSLRPLDPEQREHFARCLNMLGLIYRDLERRAEAAASYTRATGVLEPLRREHPERTDLAVLLGGVLCNQGHLQGKTGQVEDALESYRQAEKVLSQVLAVSPGDATAAQYLFNTFTGRTERLADSGDLQGAVAACEAALASVPDGFPYAPSLRLHRTYYTARLGDHARAAREAEALAGEAEFDPAAKATLAAVYALSAGAAQPDDPDASRRYAERALDWLRAAVSAGALTPEKAVADPDFVGLRDHPEFQKLVGGARSDTKT